MLNGLAYSVIMVKPINVVVIKLVKVFLHV